MSVFVSSFRVEIKTARPMWSPLLALSRLNQQPRLVLAVFEKKRSVAAINRKERCERRLRLKDALIERTGHGADSGAGLALIPIGWDTVFPLMSTLIPES
ncbi:hypothetical protein EVAR_9354_1 [Eumeta japonica]|uniref:Uncharacterized protein n=1 Tax=Eumeta variegata TaxID=151549 RepID=A0A4C1YQ05_EUMVA|nr:hypothetical protein EVAR_9354_1 [Eumeta japonica]